MTRVFSAAALVVVVVGVLWASPAWATLGLAVLVAALAGHEMAAIAGRADVKVPSWYLAAASALVVPAFALSARTGDWAAPLAAVLLALVLASALITMTLDAPGPATLGRAAVMTMAPLYVGLPLGVLAWVQATGGPGATSWVLAVVAVSDTAQYYTGRAFGRTKLAPIVSPSKTREGAVGGLVVASATGAALGALWLPELSMAGSAGLALALAAFGMAGDLFESALKRGVNLKDSSTIIPGHGGVLDRIDSHLFAAPVFYLAVRYLV